jgi:uncharacterized membrane protein YgcG
MKTKYTLLVPIVIGTVSLGFTATAQEIDDMYFTAGDRVALGEKNQAVLAARYAESDRQAVRSNPVNPSDTYTGRGVNPEFSAQQKNGAELVTENPDYYLASYTPKDVNSKLYSGSNAANCGCNAYSGYGNPYGRYSSPYGMYSPYSMSGLYSPYGMYSPYGYGSGMSMSMMYGMGSMMYGGYYGYSPYGYNPYGYGYGTTVVVVDPVATSHGRRPVRASTVNYVQSGTQAAGFVAGTNGRTRNTTSANYYDPSWRNNPSNFPTRSYNYGGRNSGYNTNDFNSRSRSYNPGSFGSSSRGSFGGASGGGSTSGGGGHSRGRN